MATEVSFVLPACNEAAYIAAAVRAIHRAMQESITHDAYEVIVVDDRSDDGTGEIARGQGATVVSVCERNIAAARNAGARHSTGRFLIFVDADTQVDAALVAEALQALRDGSIWGTAFAMPADRCPVWARLGLIIFNHYYVRWRECAYGFFFFVTRDAFSAAGPFPIDAQEGEDMALSKSLCRHYGPPTVCRHRVRTSARKTREFSLAYHLKMLWLAVRFGDDMYARPEIADYRDGDRRSAARKPGP